jgi:hypothetical protein
MRRRREGMYNIADKIIFNDTLFMLGIVLGMLLHSPVLTSISFLFLGYTLWKRN